MVKSMKTEILKLRTQGLSYNEIATALGCAKSTVSFHCRKESKFKVFKKPTEEKIIQMQEFYDKCKSCIKTAKEFEYSKSTVLKYIITIDRKKMDEETIKKRRSNNVISWRQKVKQKLIEYKGGECVECGYKKCSQSLEFHHLNPEEKDFTISGKSCSLEMLKKEVDKCILVCRNCHGEIHAGLNENYKL